MTEPLSTENVEKGACRSFGGFVRRTQAGEGSFQSSRLQNGLQPLFADWDLWSDAYPKGRQRGSGSGLAADCGCRTLSGNSRRSRTAAPAAEQKSWSIQGIDCGKGKWFLLGSQCTKAAFRTERQKKSRSRCSRADMDLVGK